MPVLYCLNCGSKNSFQSSKPKFCGRCQHSFDSNFSPEPTPLSSKKVSESFVKIDPLIEKKRALLAERRGSRGRNPKKTLAEESDLDLEDDFSEDSTPIKRPKKFVAEIIVDKPLSVGSLGDYLRSSFKNTENE